MGISRDKKEAKARSFFWKTKMVFLFSAVGSIFGVAVAIFEIGKKTMEFVLLNRAGALVDFFNLSLELGHFFDGARTAFYFFQKTRENPVILAALSKIEIYGLGGAALFSAPPPWRWARAAASRPRPGPAEEEGRPLRELQGTHYARCDPGKPSIGAACEVNPPNCNFQPNPGQPQPWRGPNGKPTPPTPCRPPSASRPPPPSSPPSPRPPARWASRPVSSPGSRR